MDSEEAFALLEAEWRSTSARLQALDHEFDTIVTFANDSNLDDEHDPEGTTIAFERARAAALRDEARAHLFDIERARDRVRAGTFGRCASCGQEIDIGRLTARPTAERCMACASSS